MSTQYRKAVAAVDDLSEALGTLKVQWLQKPSCKRNIAAPAPQSGFRMAIKMRIAGEHSMLGAMQAEDVHQAGFDATEWAGSINAAIQQLADLSLDSMRNKASETDPQKRTYGPAMSAKASHMFPRLPALTAGSLSRQKWRVQHLKRPARNAQVAVMRRGMPPS